MLNSKNKRKLVRKKFIFISLIISISIMGVGYAAWNGGTKIDLSIKTGFINPLFILEDEKIAFNNGTLFLSLSDDRRTLNIDGEVYSSFNEDLTIKIADEGTIPSVFNNLREEDIKNKEDRVSELSRHYDKQMKSLYINDDYIESFKLNINSSAKNDDNNKISVEAFLHSSSDEISSLEQEIKILEEKIKLYEREESYDFQYILNFEQGL